MKDYIQNLLDRKLSTRMKNREEILEGFDDAGDTLIKAGYQIDGVMIKDLIRCLRQKPNMPKEKVQDILEKITYSYFYAHTDLKEFMNKGNSSPSRMIH